VSDLEARLDLLYATSHSSTQTDLRLSEQLEAEAGEGYDLDEVVLWAAAKGMFDGRFPRMQVALMQHPAAITFLLSPFQPAAVLSFLVSTYDSTVRALAMRAALVIEPPGWKVPALRSRVWRIVRAFYVGLDSRWGDIPEVTIDSLPAAERTRIEGLPLGSFSDADTPIFEDYRVVSMSPGPSTVVDRVSVQLRGGAGIEEAGRLVGALKTAWPLLPQPLHLTDVDNPYRTIF
jgi:hypothetical protein